MSRVKFVHFLSVLICCCALSGAARAASPRPVIKYSTYLGGNDEDIPVGVATDADGFIYMVGSTQSTDLFTVNAIEPNPIAGIDIFVVKLTPDGGNVVFATYLGGTGDDIPFDMKLLPEGLIIVGSTNSDDFPTTNGIGDMHTSTLDGFVMRLSLDGSTILNSMYLGGFQNQDTAYGVDADSNGNIYVTGQTFSDDFPTSGGFREDVLGLGSDAFAVILRDFGASIGYGTMLGGNDEDLGLRIKATTGGDIYVAGETSTNSDFPITPGAFQEIYGGGSRDGFLCRIDPVASAITYSTYLGGSGLDDVGELALDPWDRPAVSGDTNTASFPTHNPLFPYSSLADSFVTVLNVNGEPILSTHIGGSSVDRGLALAFDEDGNLFLGGSTNSDDIPTTNAYQPVRASMGVVVDSFLARIALDPIHLDYLTYIGGSGGDVGEDIFIGDTGDVYFTGWTWSLNLSTPRAPLAGKDRAGPLSP